MIPFVRDFAFVYGRPDQVSPRIRRVVAANPGPLTFTGTGTYIVGSGDVAVIDPGPAEAGAPGHLRALLDTLRGERVKHIVVTHSHLDHSPLARALQAETGAPVCGRALQGASGPSGEESHDLDFRPDLELADGDRLRGPDWTLETLATPGHASNHLAFALLEENALFSGDHVMGWSTTVVSPPDGDMGAYLSSLDRVIARGFASLWPAHGPPVTNPGPFLQAYRAHRLDREAQVLAALAGGPVRIAEIVPKLYAETDPRLWPAAARSVWAHLIQLVRTGRAATNGEAGLESVYRLA
jgi:glyoxylase-like metal-dependent hydrolase (beta-lactamase superfamily II)